MLRRLSRAVNWNAEYRGSTITTEPSDHHPAALWCVEGWLQKSGSIVLRSSWFINESSTGPLAP